MEAKIDALYECFNDLPTKNYLKNLISNIFAEREESIIQSFRDALKARDEKIAELEKSLRKLSDNVPPLSHPSSTPRYNCTPDIVDKDVLDG